MKQVKIYLVDENGNSPNFGVDETIELEQITFEAIAQIKVDCSYHLVANEGFEWSEVLGFQQN